MDESSNPGTPPPNSGSAPSGKPASGGTPPEGTGRDRSAAGKSTGDGSPTPRKGPKDFKKQAGSGSSGAAQAIAAAAKDQGTKGVAKEAGKQAALQAGARAANAAGVPISAKQLDKGTKIAAKVAKRAAVGVIATLVSFAMVIILVVVGGGGRSQDLTAGLRPLFGEEFGEMLPAEASLAYQRAAIVYNDSQYGPVPWTILAAIGAAATDHGRYSPYDDCDRRPGTSSAWYPSGAPEPDRCMFLSWFPSTNPYIEDPDGIGGVGPMLLLPSSVPAAVDPQLLQARGSKGSPESATSFIAFQLDQIRRTMVSEDGWEIPPDDGTDLAAVDAFWTEAVSRLPISDPRAVKCATPSPANTSEEVAAAISSVWRCELRRAPELHHLLTSPYGATLEQDKTAAAEMIVSEALQVAWAWSEFGATRSTQDLCGREATVELSIPATEGITIIGDSLTVGVDGFIQADMISAGAAESNIVVDAEVGRRISYLNSLSDQHLSGTVVVALGTNDAGTSDSSIQDTVFGFLAGPASSAKVLWVDVAWDDASHVNSVIGSIAESNDRLTVAPWRNLLFRNAEWLAGDGIHLSGDGYQNRSEFITDQVAALHGRLVRPDLVGGVDSDTAEPADPNSPIGVFPMTVPLFDEYNPVPGASRCDFGPNIHAAVHAFIAGERVHPDVRELSTPAVSTDEGVWPFEAAVGGWGVFPGVLGGDDEFASFVMFGPDGEFVPAEECVELIETWVDQLEDPDRSSFFGVPLLHAVSDTGEVTVNVDLLQQTVVRWDVAEDALLFDTSPVGTLDCAGRADGSVEMEAAAIVYGRLVAYTEAVLDDSTTDVGVDETSGQVDTPQVFGDADDDMAVRRANLSAAYRLLTTIASNAEGSVAGPARVGADSMVLRLSATGRLFDVPPRPALVETSFAAGVVQIAVAIAGLVPEDPRVSVSPWQLIAQMSSRGATLLLAIAGVPPALLAAVNAAISDMDVLASGCTADAAFLLATAKAETGPWWDRIQPDGTMVPALTNSSDASGPFQFIPSTWQSWVTSAGEALIDGTGDGIADVQNAFDAARASLVMQCGLAVRYGGDLTDEETAWQVAVDYHDGAGSDREARENCRTSGAYLASLATVSSLCQGEAYARIRLEFAAEFRAAMTAAVMSIPDDPNFDPTSLAGRAVQYAVAQIGKPYCKPSQPELCPVPVSTLTSNFVYGGGSVVRSTSPTSSGNYRFGPDAYDCSGLVYAAYWFSGMNIVQTSSHYQFSALPKVSAAGLHPGDLLFYDWPGDEDPGVIDHVAMYAGGGMMVHAKGTPYGVVIESARLSLRDGFVGAARPSLVSSPLPGEPAAAM